MEALKKQEEQLKSQLEDAATVTERRQIRSDLREIRRKIQDFNLNTDETANTILPKDISEDFSTKRDINSNTTKAALETDSKVQTKNSVNELKTNSETKMAESKKPEQEYKINDDTIDLKVKSADERANRRAKRQERMARLAKEQTEGTVTETNITVTKKEVNGFESPTKDSKIEEKPKEYSSKFESRNSYKTEGNIGNRRSTSDKTDEFKTEVKFDKKTINVPVEKKDEKITSIHVDAPKSFIKTTERKVQHTFYKEGQKNGGVQQTIEEKSVISNGEKTTYTSRTNSRLSNSLERFGGTAGRNQPTGSQCDKQKAVKAIGNALNIGSIRDRFASAEKQAPSKAMDLGLNFSKKVDKPAGYTVKKYTEVKVEERTTSSKPPEFGLSFNRNIGQQQKDNTRSNLKETSIGSNYKKTNPVPHPRHQTAPAAPAGGGGFSMPGGGSKASSVQDRMKFFREAQEKEKAQEEKQKKKEEQRARLASAPASTNSQSSTENRTAPCLKKRDVKKPVRRTMSISSIVLDWCREMVKDYGIEIKNFSGSWSSGLAFCALIHKFNPDKFDYNSLDDVDRERNFKLAFDTAFEVKKIPMLLDVEDMVKMARPEPRSVQCYVQWIWSVYGPTSGYGPSQEEIKQAAVG